MGSRRDRSRSPMGYNHAPRGGGGGGRRKFQIILKNLAFEVDWKRLKELCKDEVGDVKYANVVQHNGRSAGFGFAEFGSDQDLNRALTNLHRLKFCGRELHVFEDSDERELNKMKKGIGDGGGRGGVGGGAGGMGGNPGRREDRRPPPRGEPPTLNGMPITTITGLNLDDEIINCLGLGPIGTAVFVHNLLFEITESKLRDVFALAGSVQDVEMQKQGYAVITFSKPTEAVKAVILFSGQELCGRKIMIKIDSQTPPKNNDRGPPPRNDRGPPPRNDRGPPNNDRGPPPRNDRGPPNDDRGPPPRNDRGPPNDDRGRRSDSYTSHRMADSHDGRDFRERERDRDRQWDARPPPPDTRAPPNDEWRYNPPPTRIPDHRTPPDPHMSRSLPPPQPNRSHRLPDVGPPMDHGPPPSLARNKISLANLPITVTTQTIRELFERVGDVDYVQLSDGGRCELEFFNEYGASEAVSKFDKYVLDGREIRVYQAG